MPTPQELAESLDPGLQKTPYIQPMIPPQPTDQIGNYPGVQQYTQPFAGMIANSLVNMATIPQRIMDESMRLQQSGDEYNPKPMVDLAQTMYGRAPLGEMGTLGAIGGNMSPDRIKMIGTIRSLLNEGKAPTEIGKQLGLTRGQLAGLIDRNKLYGTVEAPSATRLTPDTSSVASGTPRKIESVGGSQSALGLPSYTPAAMPVAKVNLPQANEDDYQYMMRALAGKQMGSEVAPEIQSAQQATQDALNERMAKVRGFRQPMTPEAINAQMENVRNARTDLIPQERLDQAKGLLDQGKTLEEVGNQLGLSKDVIHSYVRRYGLRDPVLTPRSQGVQLRQQIEPMLGQGMSLGDIAKQLGLTRSQVGWHATVIKRDK